MGTPERLSRLHVTWLVLAIVVSFVVKVILASRTYGTNDVLTWEFDLEQLRSNGSIALYRAGVILHPSTAHSISMPFNHPPFMTHALRFWGWLSIVSDLPLRLWMRLSCAIADAVSAVLLVKIMQRSRRRFRMTTTLMMIVAPASILISGFHGNTDPIMMMFILLCLYLSENAHEAWCAGFALGMAMNIKIIPVLFIPAMILFRQGWKARAQFLAAASGVFLIASLPVIVQAPKLIVASVFGYSSAFGKWGIPTLTLLLKDKGLPWPADLYVATGKWITLVLIIVLSLWMNHRSRSVPIVEQTAVISFCLLAAGSGFGIQYLAWLVPWTSFVPAREAAAFHLTSSLALFTAYNRAAGGMPWYLADFVTRPSDALVLMALIPCWVVICWLTISQIRRL